MLLLACGADGAENYSAATLPIATPQSDATVDVTRERVGAVLANLRTLGPAAADSALGEIIDGPAFGALSPSEQHAVLAVASRLAVKLKHTARAQRLAIRATALPGQNVDDWEVRARASYDLGDIPDAARCMTQIVRRWPAAFNDLPDSLVARTAAEADKFKLDGSLREMLQALFDIRWHFKDGTEPSYMWLQLTGLLLAQDRIDSAVDVASHITSPYALIAMHADNRYKLVLKSKFVESRVARATTVDIESRRSGVKTVPRSLERVTDLASALLHARRENDALTLMSEVIDKILSAPAAAAPYDDINQQLGAAMGVKAKALSQLGRFDDAVRQLREAVKHPAPVFHAGQQLNLAIMLCELERCAEALAVLPEDNEVTAYGRMRIRAVRAMAATEQHDDEGLRRALDYLREHEVDSFSTLQSVLLWAGEADEAARLMIARLLDPSRRIAALQEIQEYSEPPAPPRLLLWRAGLKALRDRPDVRQAVRRVGHIEAYSLMNLSG